MQKEHEEIFLKLKPLLEKLCPPLECRTDKPGKYEVYGKKKVMVGKKEYDGMYFASVIVQKNFVGFYFFPIYTHPHEFADMAPGLKKCLKGKSCFHIKKNDEELFGQINILLKKGIGVYKKTKWV